MKLITKIICLFCLLGALVACDPKEEQAHRSLIMATSSDYPPFEFQQNGEIVGFDIDIARAIADQMGVKLTILDQEFPGLIPALNSGRVDFVISAMGRSPEREKVVDFSDAYHIGRAALLTRKSSNIKGFADMAGKTFGVQLGTVWEKFIQDNGKKTNFKVLTSNLVPQLIEELKIGRIDATVMEAYQVASFVDQNPELTMEVLDEVDSAYVVMLKKHSPLTPEFNQAIAKLKQEGTLDKIAHLWFKPK
ncbi:MAG: Arginine-binding extracellular protein ArtP precursor [Pseudomonadota bacterium]